VGRTEKREGGKEDKGPAEKPDHGLLTGRGEGGDIEGLKEKRKIRKKGPTWGNHE